MTRGRETKPHVDIDLRQVAGAQEESEASVNMQQTYKFI